MKFISLIVLTLVFHVQALAQKPSLSFDPVYVSTVPTYGHLKGWFADTSGNRYVINANKISTVSPLGQFTLVAGTGIAGFANGRADSAQFSNPVALATDAAGNIYVSDSGNYRIRKITPNGQVSTLAGSGIKGVVNGTGPGASFYALGDITADSAGNVYIIDQQEVVTQTTVPSNATIRKITPAGVVTTFGPSFTSLISVSADKEGNVWTTSYGEAPKKYSPQGILLLSTPPLYHAQTITTDKNGNAYVHAWAKSNPTLFIANDSVFIDKIFPSGRRARLAGGIAGYTDSSGAYARFITGLAEVDADDAGNLYVSEEGHTRKMSKPDLHFVTNGGKASMFQTFSVSGNYLTGAATLTAPIGYELSLHDTGAYAGNLAISQDGGEVLARTVYIRLKAGLAAGTYIGNVLFSSNTAITRQLPVTGIATNTPIAGTGLQGVYYKGMGLAGTPLLTRTDSTINFEFSSTHLPLSPAPGIVPNDSFSVRWTGQVQAQYTETYTFYSLSDDGMRLWVNGVKVIDNWLSQGDSEKMGTIALVAGQKYNIIIEYFEATGAAVSKLFWSSPSITKTIVPQSQLYTPSVTGEYNDEIEVLKNFITKNGSLVAHPTGMRPLITLGAYAATLTGTSVSRNDNRIRYIGGHTVENFDNFQPGNYPKDQFTSSKNVSFSANERSSIGSIVEFDITCPRFEIFEYEIGGGVRVLVDNQIAGAYSYRSTGDLNHRLFDFTALNAKPVKRHIRLEYSDRSVIGGLKLDTAGVLLPLQDTVSYRVCWLGDSFTEGAGVTSNQTLHDGLAAHASKILGFRDYRMSGFGGTGYNASFNPGFTSPRPSLADRINYDGINADVFVIAMGLNDSESDSALAGKITFTLDNLRATNPAALIFVLGPYGNGIGTNIKPNVENAIITAAANRAGVKYISVYDIPFSKSDPTHPDSAGHIALGAAIASRIKARVGAVDAPPQTPLIGNGTGLNGHYIYQDLNLTTLADTSLIFLERLDSTINFSFTNANQPLTIAPVANQGYGVRWTGKIQAQYSELYTFYTSADDGIRLWINGVLLIDNWVNHAAIEKSQTITLIAGQQYDIKIEHYQLTGDGVAKLYWSSPSTPKTIVPKSQLYPALIIGNLPPSCASNISPASGATLGTATTAKLVWAANSKIIPDTSISYDVYIWTGAIPPETPTATVDTSVYIATGLTDSTLYKWFVVPKIAGVSATGCAAGLFTFTTAVRAGTSCVTLTAPANNLTLSTSNTASFAWNPVAGAASYNLYIWVDTSAAPTKPTRRNIISTTYDTTGLSGNTSYKWYVIPTNADTANNTCAAGFFTFTTAIQAPAGCATLTAPANNTVLDTQTSAHLAWSTVAGATSYDMYIWTGNGSAPATPVKTGIIGTTYDTTGLIASTKYQWYVLPKNAGGSSIGCSAGFFSFTTDTLPVPGCVINTSPVNGTTLATQNTATLTWPASATATSYDVYLAAGAGKPSVLVTNTTALTYNATGLTAGTLYSWYIAPKNAGGTDTTCAVSNRTTFTTAAAPLLPACIINTSPATASVLPSQTSARLVWPAASGATSYDVYLAAGNAVPTVLKTNTTALTYYATGLTPGTLYSWYIAPKNANGTNTACGAASKTTFTTAAATGGANQPPAANAGANITIALPVTTVTLNGTGSYDPDGSIIEYYWYQVQGPVTTAMSNFTATPVVTGLTTAGTYIFYLQAKDNSGVNAYSGVTVIVNPLGTPTVPACVTNTAPAAGTTLATQNTATLTWNTVAGATSYDVYLAAGTGTPAVLVTNTTASTYTVNLLNANTTYSWYIAPKNAVGVATGCAASNTTTFTTAAPTVPLAACVINTSPANATTLATQNTATLTWPASVNATSYDVYLAAGNGTPAVLVSNTAALTYNATGLTSGTLYSWYIAPRNASGANTACAPASVSTFTTATPPVPACVINTSPATGTVLPSQTSARLVWPAASGATSYDVYLATGTAVPTVLKTNTTALTYYVTGLTPATLYTWYIAPRNASGVNTACGAASKTTFTTAAATGAANQPPVANAGADITITLPVTTTTLNGTASYDPDGSIIEYYWFQVQGPVTAGIDNFATSPTVTGLVTPGTYIFYLQAKDNNGINAYSGVTVVVNPAGTVTVPACVTNTSPAIGATLGTQNTATLTWPASVNATSYDFYLATGGGIPAILVSNTTALTYNATGLLPGTLYSWYVAPRNASGVNTACAVTNTTTFTTAAPIVPVPACVINTSPVNGTTLASQNTATLTWPSSANATSYDVYLAAGAGKPSLLVTNTTALTYNATGLTPGTLYSWYIAPRNASGTDTTCAATKTTTFTTAAPIVPVPACVINTSPVNGTTLATQNTATLTWPASATATSYNVYLAAGAGKPSLMVTNTTALTYNATGLTAGTLYSWYIAPKNASGTDTTCAATKTTTFTTAAPIVPVPACVINTSPVNGITLATQNTATLTWPASATATSYDVYLAAGAGKPSLLATNTTALTYNATGLTAGTLYSWYIAPKNASGTDTTCAVTKTTTFTTAVPIVPVPACVINTSPVNGTTLATQNTATLTWPASATATSYDVYLAPGAGKPSLLVTNTTALTYNATGLTAGTLYSWYIAPKNASGTDTTCAVTKTTTFTTAAAIVPVPACVMNTSPVNGATLATQNTATLVWPTSVNATSYDVYLAAGAGKPSVLVTNTTALTYNAIGLTAGTLYSWYIAPRNASGTDTTCAVTKTTTFTTAAPIVLPPACVINTSPVNGTTLATQNTATLTWPASATATSYDVYLAPGAGKPSVLVTNTTALTYNATGLTAGTLYSWYIAPRNASGTDTICAVTKTTTFTTAAPIVLPPACVINTSPVNGTTLATQNTATLTWPASATATSYDVYLAPGAGKPSVLVTNTTALTYNATGLTAGTLYSWYIAPKNASGTDTTCAVTKTTTFTTAAAIVPVPACVINTSPGNGTSLATQTTATLTWPASVNATSYDVYLAPGAGKPSVLVTNTTALTYNATGLTASTLYSWYIAPKNASGTDTTCAATKTTTFTTAAAVVPVPACVINTSPVNGATLATQNTATLTWPASATATSYDVYLAAGAGKPSVLVTNTTALTYNATGLTAGTLYSWYIAPKNAGGTDTTCAVSNRTIFTTAAAPLLPACIINTSPATASVLPSQTSARLVWPAASGATSYDVYLAAGNAVPTVLKTNTTALTYYATGLTPGTLYSWYIAPKNANGTNTACGAASKTTFTTAAATGGANQPPAANAGANITIALPVTTVTLNGTGSYDPDGSIIEYYWYQVQGPVTTAMSNFTATPVVTGLTTAGTYIFYLQAKDNSGVNAYSGVTVIVNPLGTPTVPACVTNTAPAAGTTLATQNTATLTWNTVAGATSYDVYLAAGTGTPAVLVTNTTASTYTVNLLNANTTYSWYIAPKNAVGVATGCAASNTTTFTTAAPTVPLAACVINTSPANATTLATQNTATLTWPASVNATSYDVYLAAGNGTPAVLVSNTAALTYNATGLTSGTLYSWYIAPRNASGANTACAPASVSTFTTATPPVPACVINTSPATGTVLPSQTSARLVWPAASGATSYDVYLATGTAVPTVLKTNTTALTYYVTGLTPATLYTWYIAPRNASGVNTACGAASKTTFTTAAATGAANQPPVANAGADITITLPVTTTTLNGTASYDPDGSIIEYYWFQVQGPVTAGIDNFATSPTVTGLITPGTYIFYLQAKDNNGINAYSGVTVVVKPEGTVTGGGNNARVAATDVATASVVPLPVTLSATVTPNPVKPGQYARMLINTDKAGSALLTVMNSVGGHLISQRLNLQKGFNITTVNTTALAQGLYFINVANGDKAVTVKLVVD